MEGEFLVVSLFCFAIVYLPVTTGIKIFAYGCGVRYIYKANAAINTSAPRASSYSGNFATHLLDKAKICKCALFPSLIQYALFVKAEFLKTEDTDILDSEQAAEGRLNNLRNANCERQVMTDLGSLFSRINPFAGAYKMMAEVEREDVEKAAREGRSAVRMKMSFDTSLSTDRRTSNVPTSNEVAVIYVGEDDDIPATRSLAVHPRSGVLRNIDGICDPVKVSLLTA
ncbi:hypothetical protein D918_02321 [Trichuris suis]|nr:hypothetical protein D918_02321 [Trichuris suis]